LNFFSPDVTSEAITSKRYENGCQSVIGSCIRAFQLVPTSVTLSDLERRNSPYFALFHCDSFAGVVEDRPIIIISKPKYFQNQRNDTWPVGCHYNSSLLSISAQTIERATSFKLLGLHIASTLSWSTLGPTHIDHVIRKETTRLYFLKQLKRAGLSSNLIMLHYSASALLAMQSAVLARGDPSVYLSVHPSRSGIVSRRMRSHCAVFSASGRTIPLVSGEVNFIRIFAGNHPQRGR